MSLYFIDYVSGERFARFHNFLNSRVVIIAVLIAVLVWWVLRNLMGFIGAFGAGLFSCKVMVELVKRAKLVWFSIYCLLAAFVILIFA